MNILVVSPPTFGPSVGGAAKDIFAMARLLKEMGHTVSFYAIGTLAQHQPLIDEFSRDAGFPVRIFMPELKNAWRWVSRVLLKDYAFADRASYVFGQLVEDAAFKEYVAEFRPDTIMHFCSYSWPVAQFARDIGVKAVFRSHNYEPSFFWESLMYREMAYPPNWIRYAAKVKGERNAVRFSHAVATIPFGDVWRYQRWKSENIFLVTLTYLPAALTPSWVHEKKQPIDVFYLGASYRVRFHERGARTLIKDIAPAVIQAAPGRFRFHICGAKLPKDLERDCDGVHIIYHGYVPDLDRFLDDMDVGAFPVYTGKVMKGKVFESLCRAFPVVIPMNCLAGYALVDRREVMMAETTREFVAAIVALSDDALRKQLSEHAAEFAARHFSRDALTRVISEALAA